MRVLFFGNHDVGIAALEVLLATSEVVGVVAHPIDPEEGNRFSSVYDFAQQEKIKVIRGRGKDLKIFEFAQTVKPDLIWVTDYRYILPRHLISIAKKGAVNLHPSLLPKYRGRAPINWAIINGETEIGLTAHFIDEGVDSGDIIRQMPLSLSIHEDVGDALTALIPLYKSITSEVMSYFVQGNVPRRQQDITRGSIFPGRKPEDGRIDWNKSAVEILNLVRAVSKPYPGAFCDLHGEIIHIWKATVAEEQEASGHEPGEIIELLNKNKFMVQCGEGCLKVEEWSSNCLESKKLAVGIKLLESDMNEDDYRNIELYQSLLAEHGDSFRSLDWGSRESQIKRFEIMADIGIGVGDSLLDVGCGLADFYEWLQKNKPGVNYSGIDITPEMVTRAKARFPDVDFSNATIFDMDTPEGSFDYLVASGIFVFRKENPEEYLLSTIQKMFSLCRKGIAFNSLSLWAPRKTSEEFYADPSKIISLARTLTSKVVLRHDYHPADFTIYLYNSLTP